LFSRSRQQKYDDDDEEKFDCDKRARRFDLIRSPSASDRPLRYPMRSKAVAQARRHARERAASIIGDTWKIWAERELVHI
jgi:hypothetical protein